MRFRTLVLFAVLLGVLVSLGTLPAAAQQTQKRSEVELWPVGPPEEISYRPWDPYNLSFALEVGGQIADVSGNHDVFDTQQNYRDGFKVFSFNFRGEEKDTGAFLTDFYVQGGGWANEPYSWTKFGSARRSGSTSVVSSGRASIASTFRSATPLAATCTGTGPSGASRTTTSPFSRSRSFG
jgi:hypothetical protein